MKKPLIVLIALASLAFGCKKEDTEKPKINLEAPTNETVFKQGDSFTITGTISDNENLSQYKIDVHIGDGHNHGKMASVLAEFDFEEIKDISGTSYNLNVAVNIPEDAEVGEYHIIVDATDEAGNQAVTVEIDFDLELK